MELEELRDCMKRALNEARYLHSLGTEEVSYDLALIYGYDTQKASIAGILHDCARGISEEELIAECRKYHLPVSDIELKNTTLLHAKVGAVYAREKYGIEDQKILDAITFHTTGRPGMNLLEKIIYTADYIEPYRKQFPEMDEIRRLAYENIDQAVFAILENTLDHLREKGKVVDTLTMDTYEYYKKINS